MNQLKQVLLLYVLFSSIFSFSKDDFSNYYILHRYASTDDVKNNYSLKPFIFNGKNSNTDSLIIILNYVDDVIQYVSFNDKYNTIHQFNLKKEEDQIPTTNTTIRNQFLNSDKIKLIEKKKLNFYKKSIKTTFDFGSVTMPLKLRFYSVDSLNKKQKNFSFSPDFNLGAVCGLKTTFNEEKDIYFSALFGISITTLKVSNDEMNGYYNGDITTSAFTPSMVALIGYKKLLAGISIGWDILSTKMGKHWIYNKTPWLGFGLGVQIKDTENAQAKRKLMHVK